MRHDLGTVVGIHAAQQMAGVEKRSVVFLSQGSEQGRRPSWDPCALAFIPLSSAAEAFEMAAQVGEGVAAVS
jgi:hypothetical protein